MKVSSTVFMLLVAKTQVNINQAASYTLPPFCSSGAVNSGGLFDPTDVFTAYVDHGGCGPRGDDANAIFSCPGGYTVVENQPLRNWNIVAKIDDCNYFCYTVFACVTSTPTKQPTAYPTQEPTTAAPTKVPTEAPTEVPTEVPTAAPTEVPTEAPTEVPTEGPTAAPTEVPTEAPTEVPTEGPTAAPTEVPTEAPTEVPTEGPTAAPTEVPTEAPTEVPTEVPTAAPTNTPTITPPKNGEWFILNGGNVTEKFVSSDIIQISLPFNTSNRAHNASVFTKDCLNSFNKSAFNISTTEPTSLEPDGYVQFNTLMDMNITAINNTAYWNNFSDGARGGWVEVCVQTYLTFVDIPGLENEDAESDQKLSFKNNLLNISVSLTSEFSTSNGVSVEIETPDFGDVQTNYSDQIVVYECDVDNPEDEASDRTYTQGSTLTICVTTKDTTLVQVDKFFNLFVTQDDERYNYIRNGLYNEDITTPNCTSIGSKKVCHAQLIVLARFFPESSPTNLTLSGTVFLLRNSQIVNRNLKTSLKSPDMNEGKEVSSSVISERRLQEVSGGNGEFSLEVSLQPTVNGRSDASMNYGSGPMGAMIIAAGVTGAAIMAY